MKLLFFLIFISNIFAFDAVIKYAVNDKTLIQNAHKTVKLLKNHTNAHLGVIEKSTMFKDDGGLVALKMGYIELYAANAVELQYIIKSIWPKLEKAKNGKADEIQSELDLFGFELISIKFFNKKTVLILANKRFVNRSDKAIIKILKENL